MIKNPIPNWEKVLWGVTSFVMLIGLYSWKCNEIKSQNPNDTTFPNASQLMDGVSRLLAPQRAPGDDRDNPTGPSWFLTDFQASFSRISWGFFFGVFFSVIIGIAMGCYERIEAFFYPILSFLKNEPATAALAVFFVLVGTGFKLYVWMIGFTITPTLALSIHQVTKTTISIQDRDLAYTVGASTWEVIWNVVVRKTFPYILDATRLCVGPAMVILIAAEWVLADAGFGYRLRMESRLFNMNIVYLYLVFLGFSGYLASYSILLARKQICPWYGKG